MLGKKPGHTKGEIPINYVAYALLGFMGGTCFYFWRQPETASRQWVDWVRCAVVGLGSGFVVGTLFEAPLANYVSAFLGGFAGLTQLPAYANLKAEREEATSEALELILLLLQYAIGELEKEGRHHGKPTTGPSAGTKGYTQGIAANGTD